MSTVYQNRYQHMRDFIERMGGQTALSIKIGVSKQLVSNIGSLSAKKQIGSALARKIESKLGLPIGYMDKPINAQDEPTPDHPYVDVPVLNVTASMGAGAVMPWQEETMYMVRLAKHWIRQNVNATSFDRLAIIAARGDSMSPTITSGSEVLVDTSITAIKTDDVYVLAKGDDLYIKRIQRYPDGSIEMLSDNAKYKTIKITNPLAEGFLVMGKVLGVWNFTKM